MATTPENSALYDWLIHSVGSLHMTDMGCVSRWLEDLRLMTDTECMCVLQGKSLHNDATDVVFTATKSTKECIDTIRGRAHVISSEFSKLLKKLEKERWKHVKCGSLRLTSQIRALLQECNSSTLAPDNQLTQEPEVLRPQAEGFLASAIATRELHQQVISEVNKLNQHAEHHMEVNGHMPDKTLVGKMFTQLAQSFTSLVDRTLGILVKRILSQLDVSSSSYSITSTINHIVELGLEGDHMCHIIAREGGIGRLFEVCRQQKLEYTHGAALRAMATICCVSESITELEKVGGVGHLSNMLANKTTSESVRSEAAGVIAQITSPCLDHYHHLVGFIENMDDLIDSLTRLCSEASDADVFLLGSAALANITFMDSLACDSLVHYNTVQVLIEACLLQNEHSVFTKDQVATVLANMSATEGYWPDIVENHGIAVLVGFLHEKISSCKNAAETAACERVLQKSAIALSRVGRQPETAQLVLELQGIPRLAQLCRDLKERNNSDAILVACLAALRKISTACDLGEYENADIQQLIQPKLMDSYLICSNLDESFV